MSAPEDSAPPVPDSYYFFGENYRTLCDYFHITDGAKLIIVLDLIKIVLETLFFSSYVGYLDAFIVLHLSWACIGYVGCLIGFFYKRYYYFWPYLFLKMTDCAACLSCLCIILILMLAGHVGNNLLIEVMKWEFPRIERRNALSFSLILFVILAVSLIFNSIIFDIVFRSQLYFKRRSRYRHQFQRHLVTRQVIM